MLTSQLARSTTADRSDKAPPRRPPRRSRSPRSCQQAGYATVIVQQRGPARRRRTVSTSGFDRYDRDHRHPQLSTVVESNARLARRARRQPGRRRPAAVLPVPPQLRDPPPLHAAAREAPPASSSRSMTGQLCTPSNISVDMLRPDQPMAMSSSSPAISSTSSPPTTPRSFTMDRAFGWLIEELRQARSVRRRADRLHLRPWRGVRRARRHRDAIPTPCSTSCSTCRCWSSCPGSRGGGEPPSRHRSRCSTSRPPCSRCSDLSARRGRGTATSLLPLDRADRRAATGRRPPARGQSVRHRQPAFSLRTPRWKLIRHALYDLEGGPARRAVGHVDQLRAR